MIKKIIHYCWFGNKPLSTNLRKFIYQWHQLNPNFQIIQWNQNNFPYEQYKFTKLAFEQENWAALSDYLRLIVINEYGGIYLDSDIEMLKSLNPLLNAESFLGLEFNNTVTTGLAYGSQQNDVNTNNFIKIYNWIAQQPNIKEMINDQAFITTAYFLNLGWKPENTLQKINSCLIYPTTTFCPNQLGSYKLIKPGDNSFTDHHYLGSWTNKNNPQERKRSFFKEYKIKVPKYQKIIRNII